MDVRAEKDDLITMFKQQPDYDPTYVYVISQAHVDDIGPTKVGVAYDPKHRLRTLKTAAPFPLKIHRTFHCHLRPLAFDIERSFHVTQKHRHLHGEWFDIGGELASGLLSLSIMVMINERFGSEEDFVKQAIFEAITGEVIGE